MTDRLPKQSDRRTMRRERVARPAILVSLGAVPRRPCPTRSQTYDTQANPFNFGSFRSRFALNLDHLGWLYNAAKTWNLHPAGTAVKEMELRHAGNCLAVEFVDGILSPEPRAKKISMVRVGALSGFRRFRNPARSCRRSRA